MSSQDSNLSTTSSHDGPELDDPIEAFMKYEDSLDPYTEQVLPYFVLIARDVFRCNDPVEREMAMERSYSSTFKKLYIVSAHIVDMSVMCHHYVFHIHVPENWSDTLGCQYEVSPIISAASWAEDSLKPKPNWVEDYQVKHANGALITGVEQMPYYVRCATRRENAVLGPRFIEWSENVFQPKPE